MSTPPTPNDGRTKIAHDLRNFLASANWQEGDAETSICISTEDGAKLIHMLEAHRGLTHTAIRRVIYFFYLLTRGGTPWGRVLELIRDIPAQAALPGVSQGGADLAEELADELLSGERYKR